MQILNGFAERSNATAVNVQEDQNIGMSIPLLSKSQTIAIFSEKRRKIIAKEGSLMLISFTKVWAIKNLFSRTAQGAYGPTNSKGVLCVYLCGQC